jgi:hypothetical protein
MKGWHVILVCLAVAVLAVVGTLLFVRQGDEPRYTADQVIAVAKAYAGEECDNRWSLEPSEEARWTTVYLGDGKWKVTKECEGQVPWDTTVVGDWTFYEATGDLSRN